LSSFLIEFLIVSVIYKTFESTFWTEDSFRLKLHFDRVAIPTTMSKLLTISLNSRVFLNKQQSSVGTVCNVIVKSNKNKTESTFYKVSWDNKNAIEYNPEHEYTAKDISAIQQISEEQELRYQQYAEECRQRGADHIVEQERIKIARLQLEQHNKRTQQKASSKLLNRVHKRISIDEINYTTSNTTIPQISLAQSTQDDGSFINQDAVKYEVLLLVIFTIFTTLLV
jgi:predicted DNA binding CopG/RHH family protein